MRLLLSVFLVAQGCFTPPATPVVMVKDTPCVKACSRLRTLGCPEGDDTRSGGTCEDVCKNAQDLVDARCVAGAKTVNDLHVCNVRCVTDR